MTESGVAKLEAENTRHVAEVERLTERLRVADGMRAVAETKVAQLEGLNTPLEEWRKRVQSAIRDGLRALREVQESGDVDPEEAGGAINRVEHLLLGCLPAGEQWPIPPAVDVTTSDKNSEGGQLK